MSRFVVFSQVFALDSDQLLLRGSLVRNTKWVIGICIYTGPETKAPPPSTHTHARVCHIGASYRSLGVWLRTIRRCPDRAMGTADHDELQTG